MNSNPCLNDPRLTSSSCSSSTTALSAYYDDDETMPDAMATEENTALSNENTMTATTTSWRRQNRRRRRRNAETTTLAAVATASTSSSSLWQKRKSLIRRKERVIFFPTYATTTTRKTVNTTTTTTTTACSEEENTNNDNDVVVATKSTSTNTTSMWQWNVPIHGWIFDDDQNRIGWRRRTFLALLRSSLRTTSLSSALDGGNEQGEDENNNHSPHQDDEDEEDLDVLNMDDDNDDVQYHDDEVEVELDLLAQSVVMTESNANTTTTTRTPKQILARRILPFIVDNHRGRRICVRFIPPQKQQQQQQPFHKEDQENEYLEFVLTEPSGKNGHFHANLTLTEEQVQKYRHGIIGYHHHNATSSSSSSIPMYHVLKFQAVTGIPNDTRIFEGRCLLLTPEEKDEKDQAPSSPTPSRPLSIISDIDDTVKISDVLEKKKLIRHTFLEEFRAVPGMAGVYQEWKRRHAATFHFVSSSPWQLVDELETFLTQQGFPTDVATYHCKSIRLKDRTLLDLTADPMQAKVDKIASLIETMCSSSLSSPSHATFSRQFVLVGDTGERDPEVYGELCRRYPDRIARVFLRDVTTNLDPELVDAINRKKAKKGSTIVLNHPDRLTTAFRDVPDEKWCVFTHALELLDVEL